MQNLAQVQNGRLAPPMRQDAYADGAKRPEAVAHTGFSYGVGTVSSPGPYPEKAPPLFLFSSNLRYIIFQNHI